jgi:hypothetical protein
MNIVEAMESPKFFREEFGSVGWFGWKALLSGFYGLDMSADLKHQYQAITGDFSPSQEYNELWLAIGRRGGKSHIAALLAVYEAVFNDHKSKLSAGEVATVSVIAADRKQARTVMRYIRALLLENPMLKRLVIRDQAESIELANRCAIEIMTASHRSTRGYTSAAAICDEIAFWHSDGANPDKEIINALRPSLATLGGKLICLSSPYARKGILWETYRDHYGKTSPILVAQADTLTMNPTLPKSIVDEAYQQDPIAASAEYGAQFRTDVESYVTYESLEAVTRPSNLEIMPARSHRYSAFVDPSGGSADAFTLAIVHRENNRVIVDAMRKATPPFSPEAVVEDFCQLLSEYRVTSISGDNYAGEWPKEQFRKRGVQYVRSEKPKSQLYRDLLPLINSESVEFPPDRMLLRELQGLERRTSRTGRDTIDHGHGAHDDLANAVAGACVYSKPFNPPNPTIRFNS